MEIRLVTLEELMEILCTCAGVDEDIDLGGDVIDVKFEDLGYDSLALLEAAGQLTREYGVALDDDTTASANTPRRLLEVVNGQLRV